MMKLFDNMRHLPALGEPEDFSEKTALIERQNALWREVAVLEREQEHEDALPPHMADAINILCHTKIGRGIARRKDDNPFPVFSHRKWMVLAVILGEVEGSTRSDSFDVLRLDEQRVSGFKTGRDAASS
jgi:hypothetical protein